MIFTLIALSAVIVALLAVLFWALRGSGRGWHRSISKAPGEGGRTNIGFLPQVRQALQREDDEFLARAAIRGLRGRVSRERRRVALSYLSALRLDFEELMHTSRVIAALSPEIGVAQEFERLRLRMSFLWRYRMIRLSLKAGFTPLPQISDLANVLSGYSVRLEVAMKELGERAAIMAEMVSAPDRRRIHPV